MKKIKCFFVFFLLLTNLQNLQAATTATATVTYTIGAISAITVSGNPGPLNVNAAVAGSPPSSATDSTTTYSVTTNGTNMKITGSVGAALPTGVSLAVTLAAPSGATSAGAVNLTTTAQNLVTGLTGVAASALGITYALTATAAAVPVSGATAVVTYTIVQGP
ncbi:MAG: hypothetical protein BGO10_06855 [Chlamydia sp. 32-24]|nr:MAG: hypothetical protein BGO10_06855 [Chlamydia sp. 32-24]